MTHAGEELALEPGGTFDFAILQRQRLIRGSELRGPRLDSLLQLRVHLAQGSLALLNLAQHLIESANQEIGFVVVTSRSCPHGVVLVAGNDPGNLRQMNDGFSDSALEYRCDQKGGNERNRQDDACDSSISLTITRVD